MNDEHENARTPGETTDETSAETMSLAFLREGLDRVKEHHDRNYRVTGDLIEFQRVVIDRQQKAIETLQKTAFNLFLMLSDRQDTAADKALEQEHATTTGSCNVIPAENPRPPEGSGWRLLGTAGGPHHMLVWTWRRPRPAGPAPEARTDAAPEEAKPAEAKEQGPSSDSPPGRTSIEQRWTQERWTQDATIAPRSMATLVSEAAFMPFAIWNMRLDRRLRVSELRVHSSIEPGRPERVIHKAEPPVDADAFLRARIDNVEGFKVGCGERILIDVENVSDDEVKTAALLFGPELR